ncbi:unnamed protein product, partial [Ectocarpus sp. 12 AP-2014]
MPRVARRPSSSGNKSQTSTNNCDRFFPSHFLSRTHSTPALARAPQPRAHTPFLCHVDFQFVLHCAERLFPYGRAQQKKTNTVAILLTVLFDAELEIGIIFSHS